MGTANRVMLATCSQLPEPNPDAGPLLHALTELGIDASWIPWDGPGLPREPIQMCVIRSTWNYHRRLPQFLHWLEAMNARCLVLNPIDVIRWNCDKNYLQDLQKAGIPTVPTEFVPRDYSGTLKAVLSSRGWTDIVLKPTVSAGSWNTRRFTAQEHERAADFLGELTQQTGTMVQPYMHSVESPGERSLVWIDGRWTHTVRKSARLAGQEEQIGDGRSLQAKEQEFGSQVLRFVQQQFPGDLLYARVDVVEAPSGNLLLAELELIEPSLFLQHAPDALGHLASAIARRIA